MSDLIDTLLLWFDEVTLPVECVIFEEEPDLVAARQEVFVPNVLLRLGRVVLFPGGEPGLEMFVSNKRGIFASNLP
jgi:hypothetical protein